MEYFEPNAGVIDARWPHVSKRIRTCRPDESPPWCAGTPDATLLFSGIHLTSAYNRRQEAAVQGSLVPDDATSCTVYGVALGDLQRELLQRPIASLRVVVMNPAVAASCLTAALHTDWLLDSRVSLHLASDESDLSMPFAVAPALLRLASDDSLLIRDRLIQALAAPFEAHHFRTRDPVLDERLEKAVPQVEQDGDVASLFGSQKGETVAVVSAGPTAESQFAWLSKRKKAGVIIAVSTALKPLLAGGVIPDVVVVIDPKTEMVDHVAKIEHEQLENVRLVYLPTVHPDVIRAWPGTRLVTYIQRTRFENLAKELPRGMLHCEGTVTHAAVDLAVKMGAASVILVGADFSYPAFATHMAGAVQRRSLDKTDLAGAPQVINGMGDRNPSRHDMVGFLREMERYIAMHPEVTFLNTGRAGAEIAGAVWMDEA